MGVPLVVGFPGVRCFVGVCIWAILTDVWCCLTVVVCASRRHWGWSICSCASLLSVCLGCAACSGHWPIFYQVVCFLTVEFVFFGQWSLIRYVFGKCFLPVCSSSCFLESFPEQKFLILMKSSTPPLPLVHRAVHIVAEKPSAHMSSRRFAPR